MPSYFRGAESQLYYANLRVAESQLYYASLRGAKSQLYKFLLSRWSREPVVLHTILSVEQSPTCITPVSAE